jgi:hypothetical protein
MTVRYALIREAIKKLKVGTEREWRIFFEVNNVGRLPQRVQDFVQHAFICGTCAGGLIVTRMYAVRARKREKKRSLKT